MKCLRCNNEMKDLGIKKLQDGNAGFWGEIGHLFEGEIELKMFLCSSCGYVEFKGVK